MDKEAEVKEAGPQPGPVGISQEAVERALGRKELAMIMMAEQIQRLQEQVRNLLQERDGGKVAYIDKRDRDAKEQG